MKTVVIGGTGQIGRRVVQQLRLHGCEVVAASRASGVDVYTGHGLAAALAGAAVVIDLADTPWRGDAGRPAFFQTAARQLLAAGAAAGVGHHVALSVVGAEHLPGSGYLRGKRAQEALLKAAGRPCTLLRSTPSFEWLGRILQAAEQRGGIHLPPVPVQPIAADDLAVAIARAALRPPASATMEIAGPQRVQLDALAREYLRLSGDARTVRVDPQPACVGGPLHEAALLPQGEAWLGQVDFRAWWARQQVPLPA